MRTDKKFGIIFAAVVVVIAGGYFAFRDRSEPSIPLDGTAEAKDDKPSVKDIPTKTASRDQKDESRRSGRVTLPTNSRTASKDDAARKLALADRNRSKTDPRRPGSSTTRPSSRPTSLSGSNGADANSKTQPRTTTAPRSGGLPTIPGAKTASADDPTKPSTGGVTPGTTGGDQKQANAIPERTPLTPKSGFARATEEKSGSAARPATQSEATNPRTTPGRDAGSRSTTMPIVQPSWRTRTPATRSGTSVPSGPAPIERHRVQEGDTFSDLAISYYGSERYTQFLVASNPEIADPNRLRIGMVVKIPPKPEEGSPAGATRAPGRSSPANRANSSRAGSAAAPNAAGTYVVKEGDTFYGIARDVLGEPGRWQEILELNRDRLPNGDAKALQIGQVIRLPGKAKSTDK
jgi:nucleoid-associated protein YgaU